MTKTDFREIGARLKTAFRLATRPLAVYGAGVLPEGIPAEMAERTVRNLDASFITRRPQAAYPSHAKRV